MVLRPRATQYKPAGSGRRPRQTGCPLPTPPAGNSTEGQAAAPQLHPPLSGLTQPRAGVGMARILGYTYASPDKKP